MFLTNIATTGVSILCTALLATGCLITTGSIDDDESSSNTEADTDPSATVPTSDPTSDSDSNSSVSDSVGETTGMPTGECSDNLIADGGFEDGTPSMAWTETSLNFMTPICDTDCTMDPGADPFVGNWYAWFGGIDTDPEIASVSQLVTIDGQTVFLAFRFQINAAAGTGNDFFEVTVDDETVWLATDAEIADYGGYTPISVDISDFADGNAHTITFTGDVLGEGELTNFFLDEVSLVACTDGVADTTGGSSSGDDTDTGASSDTTAADTTAADSSGSDSGSESGSSGSSDSSDSGSESGSSGGSDSSSTGAGE